MWQPSTRANVTSSLQRCSSNCVKPEAKAKLPWNEWFQQSAPGNMNIQSWEAAMAQNHMSSILKDSPWLWSKQQLIASERSPGGETYSTLMQKHCSVVARVVQGTRGEGGEGRRIIRCRWMTPSQISWMVSQAVDGSIRQADLHFTGAQRASGCVCVCSIWVMGEMKETSRQRSSSWSKDKIHYHIYLEFDKYFKRLQVPAS